MRSVVTHAISLFLHTTLSHSFFTHPQTCTHCNLYHSLSLHTTLSQLPPLRTRTHSFSLHTTLSPSFCTRTLSLPIFFFVIFQRTRIHPEYSLTRNTRGNSFPPLTLIASVCVCVCVYLWGLHCRRKKACAFLERGAVAIKGVKNKRGRQNYWALSQPLLRDLPQIHSYPKATQDRRTLSFKRIQSHSLSNTHRHTITFSIKCTHTHTHIQSHSLSNTYRHSHTHNYTLSIKQAHTRRW